MLRHWLEHPLTRGLDLDDPHTTHLRRRILAEKRFLRRIPTGGGPLSGQLAVFAHIVLERRDV